MVVGRILLTNALISDGSSARRGERFRGILGGEGQAYTLGVKDVATFNGRRGVCRRPETLA